MKFFNLYSLFFFGCVLRGSNSFLKIAVVGSKTCMKPLGCFEVTRDFFHSSKRPINALPQHREIINTRFFLFTNTNPREGYELNPENNNNLISSPLNVNSPTRFIVHGFIDTKFFGRWQELLKDELLLGNKGNIIIVDWSGGNSLPYVQASANTRVVGAEIAYLVKALEKTVNLNRSDVHIIGHSLGAHAAGYAGERLPGLRRITGLDPAEPFFQDLPRIVRLDETDARFVDVIHTDSKTIFLLGLGMNQLIGHVDFFPNNGKNQPGCSSSGLIKIFTEGLIESSRRFIACSHQRAVDFFHASINNGNCLAVGYECSSWEQFLEGKCTHCGSDGSQCGIMGLRADEVIAKNKTNVKLYLKTNGKMPFCLYHYQISFKLYGGKGDKNLKGKAKIMLHGELADADGEYKGVGKFHHGSRYFFMITTEKNIGQIKSVGFVWEDTSSNFNPLNWFKTRELFLEHITVMPMNIIDYEKKLSETKKFCQNNLLKPIYSNKLAVLLENSC